MTDDDDDEHVCVWMWLCLCDAVGDFVAWIARLLRRRRQ